MLTFGPNAECLRMPNVDYLTNAECLRMPNVDFFTNAECLRMPNVDFFTNAECYSIFGKSEYLVYELFRKNNDS